jgi:hypothetical protein
VTLLNSRIEFSILIIMFRFVGHILKVTSHWELFLIYNEKIYFFNLGNPFVRYLLPTNSLLTLRRFLISVGSFPFRMLQVAIALVALHSNIF